jgi:aminoglycoside/choline kinase family phosphotransferase
MNTATRECIIQKFLTEHGYQDCLRSHLTGDASSRAYELIDVGAGQSLVLMNAPQQPDGPPIRDGRPYSQIAGLAEDIRSFVGVAMRLEANGFRVPKIHAQDLQEGLLMIENLGSEAIITKDRKPIIERYLASMETLAQIHNTSWETSVGLADGSAHTLPPFDREAMMIEVELLTEWYLAHKLGREINRQERHRFEAIWQGMFHHIAAAEHSILLRDYHSPNIIWMNGAQGVDRTALIDFQDALTGPTAYDVASIAQDARVTVSAEAESLLVNHYLQHRNAVDIESFERTYALIAAQRATKILGIFVRLSQRDKKPAYMAHLPRVETYLKRAVLHPVMQDYRHWLQTVLNF